jgi:hypothetical protein
MNATTVSLLSAGVSYPGGPAGLEFVSGTHALLQLSSTKYFKFDASTGWFVIELGGTGNTYLDNDLVMGATGRLYIGGSHGTPGTDYLERNTANNWRLAGSTGLKAPTLESGNFEVQRDSTTFVANNFKYSPNSPLQIYDIHPSAFQATGTYVNKLSTPTWTGVIGAAPSQADVYLYNEFSAPHYAVAPVNLPNGAVIRGFQARMSDGETGIMVYTPTSFSLWYTDWTTGTTFEVAGGIGLTTPGTGATALAVYGTITPPITETSPSLYTVTKNGINHFLVLRLGTGDVTPSKIGMIQIFYTLPEISW